MMPTLVRADESLIRRIIDETYPIWNEGLSLEGYRRWNDLQIRAPWGKDHLWRVALIEGDEILASAKWYDLDCGTRVLGIGAVFTPERHRGKGHARELMRQMMATAEQQGYQAALLFSEIGAPYYARDGFTVIPRDTVTLDVVFPRQGPPATLVRGGEDADLPYLAELHAAAPFALTRTADLIKFNVVKRRARAALGSAGSRVVEFFVSEEGHRPVAYVLLSRGPSGNLGDGPEVMWLEACGDRDPSGARVGAMLQVLRARTAGEPWPPFHSWLPDGWLPPQLKIVGRAPAEDIMMIRPLGRNFLPPMTAKDVIWWHADYF
ncbi:MAG: GNAT family N-acetyltransferase [Acidobacteria bacterium]|nr:MAG: GNAT family N-acetyltransferase [Acidobacteriota bacterium]